MSPRRSGGRIASVVNALGHTTRSTHDRFGNLTKVEDALGRVSTTVYDGLQRKVIETAPEGNFVTTTYDARSNVLNKVETPKPASGLAARTVFIKT